MVTSLRGQLWVWPVCSLKVYGTSADPMAPVWRPTRLACTTLRMRVDRAVALDEHATPLLPEETPW